MNHPEEVKAIMERADREERADHTPTPWTYSQPCLNAFAICSESGLELATLVSDAGDITAEMEADARYIVTAVNSHEALVSALKETNRYCCSHHNDDHASVLADCDCDLAVLARNVRAALQAAGA